MPCLSSCAFYYSGKAVKEKIEILFNPTFLRSHHHLYSSFIHETGSYVIAADIDSCKVVFACLI